jgi:hypothetical protein
MTTKKTFELKDIRLVPVKDRGGRQVHDVLVYTDLYPIALIFIDIDEFFSREDNNLYRTLDSGKSIENVKIIFEYE